MRRLEKLRQLSRGKSSKVVELPSIGLSYESVATTTFIETKPTICTCPNLLNLQVMPKMEGGQSLPPKSKGGIYGQRPTITMQVVWGGRAPSNRMSLPSFNFG